MRHLGSLVLGLLLAPVIWVLVGVGLFWFDAPRSGIVAPTVAPALALLALLVAGLLHAVLVTGRLSPVGPALAGAAYLVLTGWRWADPGSFVRALPRQVADVDLGLTVPAGGVAVLLAVPLLATVFSPRRWRRYDRPVAALPGTYGYGYPPQPGPSGAYPGFPGQPPAQTGMGAPGHPGTPGSSPGWPPAGPPGHPPSPSAGTPGGPAVREPFGAPAGQVPAPPPGPAVHIPSGAPRPEPATVPLSSPPATGRPAPPSDGPAVAPVVNRPGPARDDDTTTRSMTPTSAPPVDPDATRAITDPDSTTRAVIPPRSARPADPDATRQL